MRKQLERTLLMGMGLLSITREKAQAFVDEIVGYGDTSREEAKGLVDKLVTRGEEEKSALRKLVREEIESSFKNIHIASQGDITALQAQVEALDKKVEALSPEKSSKQASAG